MTRVAVLGAGLLGSAFVEGFLARGGTEVAVWNRTRSKADYLTTLGAVVTDTISEAVRGAERVHTVLYDDDVVDAVIGQLKGIIRSDAIIVDHTTTLPARTARRAVALEAAGIEYLHAPVMMGPPAARRASGTMLVSGPQARFERVKGELERMTGMLWYLGERPDLAAVYKLCGNAVILSMVGVMADVFHLADAAGVERAEVIRLYDRVSAQGVIHGRGARMVDGDFAPVFHLGTARKDIRLMQETAGTTAVPVLDAVASHMDLLLREGRSEDDVAVLGVRRAPDDPTNTKGS